MIYDRLNGQSGLRVHRPEAGMFALVDVRPTGLSGLDFATSLLEQQKVAVMPGESFGSGLGGWVRLSLTQPDDRTILAATRIAAHAARTLGNAA
jgi:arginine:pyruvate transaminase